MKRTTDTTTGSNEARANLDFVDFEAPIVDLEAKIEELCLVEDGSDVSLASEIENLRKRSDELTKEIFSSLDAWQISKLARHPKRPYTLDYVEKIFDEFIEIHGDRIFSDDSAIVCGLGTLDGRNLAFIGHQKGRGTKENLARNFGMPKPEGYRKALRTMRLAERFKLPLVTFIDTPGAYPGIGAEERGQSEAIATNLRAMSSLQVPIISIVIGEGGSGGALAIGMGDRILMKQYSTYSVISPEGCASILWKSSEAASEAANAMHITADDLLKLGVIDGVIKEPLGGSHRNVEESSKNLKESINSALDDLRSIDKRELIGKRRKRFSTIGEFIET
ncbi:MAG: acetyl-CoA carboxylase carboxyltransferase subunit alpha [Pseudomonadota bacterium]|nr:acetyl-CoA carboxylase carboxyltransferase subunit alpha [Pseudomonadota bacterium]